MRHDLTSPAGTHVLPGCGAARIQGNVLARLLSNIWFGMAVLALILVYSSIVSALPPVRWTLEMTEMQAFRHPLFVTLVGLFLVSVTTATLYRTRWGLVSAGAILAHVGLLLLSGGAIAYFAAKVEGDVLLRAPLIELRVNIAGSTALLDQFPARAGQEWAQVLPHVDLPVHLTVEEVQWRGDAAGVSAVVTSHVGGREPRRLTLRATSSGWQPIHENLEVRLVTFPAQTYFYDDETPALYFRDLASGLTAMKVVRGLPIYQERCPSDVGPLQDALGQPVPRRRWRPELRLGGLTIPTGWFERWRMPVEVDSSGLPFEVRITAYLPYVLGLRAGSAASGPTTQPVLAARQQRRADILARSMSAIRLELRGRDPAKPWSQTQWCLFSMYPDVEVRPVEVALPEGGRWEITYSRRRHELGAALAARDLWVEYFPGQRGIKSYHSAVLVRTGGTAREAVVETNKTLALGRWTLFQSGFAEDHWSYSILGVGNRVGMWPMNIGWITLLLGSLYAFYVKPVLVRRALRYAAPLGLVLVLVGCRPAEPYQASLRAAELDTQIDWSAARVLAVQDAGRYKTLESFARESLEALTGSEHLPGLSPTASLLEWLFNRDAYLDTPLIRVRNRGLLARMAQPLREDQRERILRTGRLTPRELADPLVMGVLRELETHAAQRGAVNRVRNTQVLAQSLEQFVNIVPQPGGDMVAPWATPQQVLANLADEHLRELGLSRADLPAAARRPVPGVLPEQALALTVAWTSLRASWLRGDGPGVQRYLDRLTELLPQLAAPGIYPRLEQRQAEARYYAAGKFTYGWFLYFLALLVSVWTLVTGWRMPWVLTVLLLLGGLAIHVYGISLRWYILGRIPVANVFEAVVASAAAGVIIALLVELFLYTRVLLVGASATGFMALLAAQYVLPGSELSIIPAILDDIQLRLHTVFIITAYALIFLAAVVALVYLLGYYFARRRSRRSRDAEALVPAGAAVAGPTLAVRRPLLAGGTPGDEGRCDDLPHWLHNVDWSHLIILNMVFVLLFVGGIVLGAWWADYSWGRPWGWDPKEVFALNTWIIYAILIHLRFVVRRRGLWTAWLSLAGCAMMGFNWFFVNFFISSVHSYA